MDEPDDPDAVPDAAAEVDPNAGRQDRSRSVTVWLADNDVVKVLVSNRWRERSETPLGERIVEAVLAGGAVDRALGGGMTFSAPSATSTGLRDGDPRALWRSDFVDPVALRQLLEDSIEIARAPVPPEPSQVSFTPVTASSRNAKVSVTLGPERLPTKIELDADWATGARAERIGEAVQQAFAAAYAEWRAPVVTTGASGRRADEAAALRTQALALLGIRAEQKDHA